ncbi:MAG: UbiD family decarboxylase [Chloroflexota bacterium]
MGFRDLREWMNLLEAEGELKRVKARVDWNLEMPTIIRKVFVQRGPALLFENIKDHEKTWSTRMFTGGLGSRKRLCLMLGLPQDTPHKELVQVARKRFKESIKPVTVKSGPVKENIVKGEKVDLFQFPVPKWHPLDAGRYINTCSGIVTRDPEASTLNMGIYRGMIGGKNKINVHMVPAQGWGVHYSKYKEMGKPMPVAVVCGWDPAMMFVAGTPIPLENEYEVIGSVRQQPVELVKCETSDLLVPAAAEIVIEGTVSPDPASYEVEGPFGEWTGYYGIARPRPVIQVSCVTFRNDPIFRGLQEGMNPGVVNESAVMAYVFLSAIMWNTLEGQGIPGIIDVIPEPLTVVQIHKTYRGQAKQIAAAIWSQRIVLNYCKNIMVVEEDVDIHNPRALQVALRNNVDPARQITIFPGMPGNALDPASSHDEADEVTYGAGKQNHMLIDATIDWETHPIREEWGNRRYPPRCTDMLPEVEKLVEQRWPEYGI